jgi:para-nitrobenzyl esterase
MAHAGVGWPPGHVPFHEIAFAFDNAGLCARDSGGGPAAMALSQRMGEAWVSFACDGNPGHRGLPKWPAYDAARRSTMIFDNECRIASNPEGGYLDKLPRS